MGETINTNKSEMICGLLAITISKLILLKTAAATKCRPQIADHKMQTDNKIQTAKWRPGKNTYYCGK